MRLLPLLILAWLLWSSRPAVGAPTPQEPVEWWIDPTTGELVYQPGLTPPPGMRPASAWEIERYYSGFTF